MAIDYLSRCRGMPTHQWSSKLFSQWPDIGTIFITDGDLYLLLLDHFNNDLRKLPKCEDFIIVWHWEDKEFHTINKTPLIRLYRDHHIRFECSTSIQLIMKSCATFLLRNPSLLMNYSFWKAYFNLVAYKFSLPYLPSKRTNK